MKTAGGTWELRQWPPPPRVWDILCALPLNLGSLCDFLTSSGGGSDVHQFGEEVLTDGCFLVLAFAGAQRCEKHGRQTPLVRQGCPWVAL